MEAAPAPWRLSGECVIALAHGRFRGHLPTGVSRLPGPSLVVAARYDDSPVGPYIELSVAEPARAGTRPGVTVTTMVVTTPEARAGGRENWGFPKEVGNLSWRSEGDERSLEWPERGISVRGKAAGPSVPIAFPFWALQRRADGPVTVPGRLRGLLRLATVTVEVPNADPLAALGGRHRGAAVASAKLVMARARLREVGAPAVVSRREAAEPALTWAG
jgi:hypothetical protein